MKDLLSAAFVRLQPNGRLPRLAVLTSFGVIVLLSGVVAASGLASGPYSSAQTTSTTQTTAPTTVRFSFSVNAKKGQELTRASGHGTLTLAELPSQALIQYQSTTAAGLIRFHRWKIANGHVTDEDDFTIDLSYGHYRFNTASTQVGTRDPVTKAASHTTDSCSPGSPSGFGMSHGKVKSRPDFVGLEMCGVRLAYTNGVAGAHVVVTIKLEPPTG